MLKTLWGAAVISLATLSGAQAQNANCQGELDVLTKSAFDLEQKMLRKDIDSPLVVEMADGSLADLRGEEPRSQPLESWMDGAKGGRQVFETGLSKVREFASAGDDENCQKGVLELKEILVDYNGRLGTN